MTSRLVAAATGPRETRFFAAVAAWGWLTAVVYWFLSYEIVGTVLLAALGLAASVFAIRLVLEARSGDPGADRPFQAPLRAMPGETLAPAGMAIGLTACAAATIFGVAVLAVGVLTVIWAGIVWVTASTEELEVLDAPEAAPGPGHDAGGS